MVDKAVKVLIGIPTEEYSRRADFYDYFNLLNKPANSMVLFVHERSPAKSRNILIEQAFHHNCTHILFIDDDMAFQPDSLEKLLVHDKDIVSGLYIGRSYPHKPIVFDLADDNGSCLSMYLESDTPDLAPIVAAGFGFLLVKTSIFSKLEKPYVRLGELDSQEWCDDIGFFKRVREAGIESFCDTTVRCGHIGTMIIWPNKMDGYWYTGYDTTSIGIAGENGRLMVNTPQISSQVIMNGKESEVGS